MRAIRTLVRLLSVTVLVAGLSALHPALAAAAVPSVSDKRYFVGANVPWYNWACDFGCGGQNGVSAPHVRPLLADAFSRLQAANVHAVRWWMFEGEPWQINRDASGAPTGLNPAVYQDLDAALALADQYDFAYDLVLFDGPARMPRAWLTDPVQRQLLADALAPLFERYRDHPRILAWELFNEPEWNAWSNKIDLGPVQETVKLLASTVHAHTSNAVAVGPAHLDGIAHWVGLGLDFYAPHWYPHLSDGPACATCTDAPTVRASNQSEDVPIVIGEFYDPNALQRLRDLRGRGYAGAWAWSLFSDRTWDKMSIDLGALGGYTGTSVYSSSSTASDAAGTVVVTAPPPAPAGEAPGQ